MCPLQDQVLPDVHLQDPEAALSLDIVSTSGKEVSYDFENTYQTSHPYYNQPTGRNRAWNLAPEHIFALLPSFVCSGSDSISCLRAVQSLQKPRWWFSRRSARASSLAHYDILHCT